MSTETKHTESGQSPPETAEVEAQIRRDVLQYAGTRGAMVKYAIDAGNGLIKLREATEHGGFLDALSRCGLSPRQAQRFMYIARNAPRVADFSSVRQIEAAIKEERRQKAEVTAAIEAEKVTLNTATSRLGNPSIRPQVLDKRSDAEREAEARRVMAEKEAHADQMSERFRFYGLCDHMRELARDLPRYVALLPAARAKIESKKHEHQTFVGLRANLKIISKLLDATGKP